MQSLKDMESLKQQQQQAHTRRAMHSKRNETKGKNKNRRIQITSTMHCNEGNANLYLMESETDSNDLQTLEDIRAVEMLLTCAIWLCEWVSVCRVCLSRGGDTDSRGCVLSSACTVYTVKQHFAKEITPFNSWSFENSATAISRSAENTLFLLFSLFCCYCVLHACRQPHTWVVPATYEQL